MTEPPAPQPGDIVHYQDFLEIILETLEDRWLTGERPDISSVADIGDLRAALEHQVVNVAHVAHLVGEEIPTDSVGGQGVDELRTEVTELETIIDEIEREYLDE